MEHSRASSRRCRNCRRCRWISAPSRWASASPIAATITCTRCATASIGGSSTRPGLCQGLHMNLPSGSACRSCSAAQRDADRPRGSRPRRRRPGARRPDVGRGDGRRACRPHRRIRRRRAARHVVERRQIIASLPVVLTETDRVRAAVHVGSSQSGVNLDAIKFIADQAAGDRPGVGGTSTAAAPPNWPCSPTIPPAIRI